MLTGQAKTDYQREYMRKRRGRSNTPTTLDPPPVLDPEPSVRPTPPDAVRPDERTYANAVLSEPVASGCRKCKLLSYQPGKGMSCPRGSHTTGATSVFEAEVNPDADCGKKET